MHRLWRAEAARAWNRVVSGEATSGPARVARGLLRGASGLYRAGLIANRALYDRGIIPPARVDQFVIGVGNLTLGGTGKTTTSRFLAAKLLRRGLRTAIVLRGYRRSGPLAMQLVSNGKKLLAEADEVGDEAFMLARSLPKVNVAVGKRRERVCAELLEGLADVVILDDAFQYWRLEKDYEIVLLDCTRPGDLERLFPAGALREPLGALRRADAVWLTRVDQAEAEALARLRGIAWGAVGDAVVETRHRPAGLQTVVSGKAVPLEAICGLCVAALSSVGNPFAFEQSLRDLGAKNVVALRFPDHYEYSKGDLSEALSRAQRAGADMVVTTEKDAVRLPAVEGLDAVHLLTVELEVVAGEERVEELLNLAEAVASANAGAVRCAP